MKSDSDLYLQLHVASSLDLTRPFAAETGATYQEPVSHTRQTINMTNCLPLVNTLSTTKGMTESNTSHQLTSNTSMTAIIWSQLSCSRLNRSFYRKWTIFQWLSVAAIIWSQLKTFLSRQILSQRVDLFFFFFFLRIYTCHYMIETHVLALWDFVLRKVLYKRHPLLLLLMLLLFITTTTTTTTTTTPTTTATTRTTTTTTATTTTTTTSSTAAAAAAAATTSTTCYTKGPKPILRLPVQLNALPPPPPPPLPPTPSIAR